MSGFMSRPEEPKISIRAVERRRAELNSQRALLHRTLRDAPSMDDVMDVFRALEAMLQPAPNKKRNSMVAGCEAVAGADCLGKR